MFIVPPESMLIQPPHETPQGSSVSECWQPETIMPMSDLTLEVATSSKALTSWP